MRYLETVDCACSTTEKLRSVQAKLISNRLPFILVTSASNKLLGFLSQADVEGQICVYGFDGDIDQNRINPCRFVKVEGVPLEQDNRAKAYGFLPLISSSGDLLGCDYYEREKLHHLSNAYIGEGMPPFLIGEVGNNHQGSIHVAQDYIDKLIQSGFDAVKFQMRDLDEIYRPGYLKSQSRAVEDEYSSNLIGKFSLSNQQVVELITNNRHATVFATPFDLKSARLLLDAEPACVKTASSDLSFLALHDLLARSGVPVVISTGASSLDDIDVVMELYRRHNQIPILLHCVANYPPSLNQLNLLNIVTLKERYDCPVGYSSHDVGQEASIQSVGLGACIIEKHVTFNRDLEGNDHKISLPIDKWESFSKGIRSAFYMLGSSVREINQGEKLIKVSLGKSLYAKVDIPKGAPLAQHLFESRSPFKGFTELDLYKNGGGLAKKDIVAGDPLERSNVAFTTPESESDVNEYSALRIPKNFGVPVRFNDYKKAILETRVSGVEFHLSEGDLSLVNDDPDILSRIADSLKGRIRWIAIHAPEQFSGDFVVDFSSTNHDVLTKSYDVIFDTLRIADSLAGKLHLGFEVPVVANIGGMTYAELNSIEREVKQSKIKEHMLNFLGQPRFQSINHSLVKLMPQTMPPYPWIFGGSRFHNAMIDSRNIIEFCRDTGLSVTLDVAHSLMHCIDVKEDFSQFIQKVEMVVGYVHLGDAVNATSEGLALGTGALNLNDFLTWMARKRLLGVTEIWSGHLDSFSGFKTALRTVVKVSEELEINWQ